MVTLYNYSVNKCVIA